MPVSTILIIDYVIVLTVWYALFFYLIFSGDAMGYHNKMMFSTIDVDNDFNTGYNCAGRYRGGWWYKTCINADLNGLYGSLSMLYQHATMNATSMMVKRHP